MSGAPAPEETVLSTMNEDGTRRWMNPRQSDGPFLRKRRAVAWGLILLFVGIPYVKVGGKPMILLDVANREFTFFGTTLLPTDSVMLMLMTVGIFASVFLITALAGRAWCGWMCPQTVYLEFVFRPLERLILGRDYKRRGALPIGKRLALWGTYAALSLFLAHTFLAWFVGVETLVEWMGQSPFEHPTSFLVMLVTAGLVWFDFAIFREQMCTITCPYGRFQSVLLDKNSLIVGYDEKRGEPRGRKSDPNAGDCVDCKACVATCPTGIDIREGLQMECIHCTQCIDACDTIMEKLDRPKGLIRYTTQEELAGRKRKVIRPRVFVYTFITLGMFAALAAVAMNRSAADVIILRDKSAYEILPNGDVTNGVRVKIVNRTDETRIYEVTLPGIDGARLTSPNLPATLEPGEDVTANVLVVLPRSAFEDGTARVSFVVKDDASFEKTLDYKLLGPMGNKK